MDVNWELEEKSSDQLELSAGWGGGIGLTGTLGCYFNNFSIKNIFNKEAWDPLPQGDGQKAKFTVSIKWHGHLILIIFHLRNHGWVVKKRNSLTVAFYHSKYSNGYNYATGQFDKAMSDTNYLRTSGISVSLG